MKKTTKIKLYITIKNIVNKITDDNVTGFAAQSCYYIILCIVPFLMVLMSLIHFLPFSPKEMFELIQDIVPSQLFAFAVPLINDLYDNSSLTLISITAIGVLWAAGKGFMSLMRGLNKIYEVENKKNWFFQRILSTIYTIIFLFAITATMVFVVFGNKLLALIGTISPDIQKIFGSILNNKMIFVICFLLLLLLVVYKFIPNRKTTFAREFPGALLAAFGWYIFSILFSIYIDNSPKFSYMYGSLAAVVFGLIWIYFCMMIIFLGAELNVFIDKKILAPLRIHPIKSKDSANK